MKANAMIPMDGMIPGKLANLQLSVRSGLQLITSRDHARQFFIKASLKQSSFNESPASKKKSVYFFSAYTRADMVSIRIKIARRMNPTQTSERNEIFANRATFLYKQSGMVMPRVARRMTTCRWANIFVSCIPVTLIRTFVTVSPTTTLYDTIAANVKSILCVDKTRMLVSSMCLRAVTFSISGLFSQLKRKTIIIITK